MNVSVSSYDLVDYDELLTSDGFQIASFAVEPQIGLGVTDTM